MSQAAFEAAFQSLKSALPNFDGALSPERIPIGWRGLNRILELIRQPLDENDLSVHWDNSGRAGDLISMDCCITHIHGGYQRASFSVDINAFSDMSGGQAHVAAATMLKRLTLEMALGIATGDIADSLNSATDYSEPVASATTEELPVHEEAPKASLDEINELKKSWSAENKDVATFSQAEKRVAFFDWLSVQAEQRITDEKEITAELILALREPNE